MHDKQPFVDTDTSRNPRIGFRFNVTVILFLLLSSVSSAAPVTPTIVKQVSNDSRPVLSGTADPVSSSTLAIAGARYHLAVTADGQWSLDLAEARPVSGSYQPETALPIEVVVTSTDTSGALSQDSTQLELRIQLDSDNDGITDILESESVTAAGGQPDTDADGLPDYRDTDTDGDGLPDAIERKTVALSGSDKDLDNIDDAIDVSMTRGLDQNNNGVDDALEPVDSDQDGLADFADPDSDNDGISDSIEGAADTDGDGIENYLDTDSDNDGIPDRQEQDRDSDADSLPDYLDTDSDNDGIPDSREAGDHDADQIPDYRDADADNDTLPDSLETDADFDRDGVPNYLDQDSDNDGISDLQEAWHRPRSPGQPAIANSSVIAAVDTDQDGLPDFTDLDSDNDGLPDVRENAGTDLDHNGILDAQQAQGGPAFADPPGQTVHGARDSDFDLIADFRDLDSDNDGIPDLRETYGGPDQQPGTLHVFVDSNKDGLDDLIALKVKVRDNADRDGQSNYLDLDSDNNGQPDLAQAGLPDQSGDGIVDSLQDTDRDGIPDSVDVSQTGGADRNGNGIDDASDARFLGTADTDADGIVDTADPDADGNGLADLIAKPARATAATPMKPASVDITNPARHRSSSIGCSVYQQLDRATVLFDPLLLLLLLAALARVGSNFKNRFKYQ